MRPPRTSARAVVLAMLLISSAGTRVLGASADRPAAACCPNVGLGLLDLGSQSPFQAMRLCALPRSPSRLEPGEWEIRGGSTWSNIWAPGGDAYLLDFETLDTSVAAGVALPRAFRLDVAVESRSRFGGHLDGLIEGFHDALGLPQDHRDDFPRDDFQLRIGPAPGRAAIALEPGDRGTFAQGLSLGIQRDLTRGGEGWPAVAVGLSLRAGLDDGGDLGGGTPVDVGLAVAASKRLGRSYLYGSIAYARFGATSFRGLPLDAGGLRGMVAAEWPLGAARSLLLEYLVSQGAVAESIGPFASPSHELFFGVKCALAGDAFLEAGVVENLWVPYNGPDFGLHLAAGRRFGGR